MIIYWFFFWTIWNEQFFYWAFFWPVLWRLTPWRPCMETFRKPASLLLQRWWKPRCNRCQHQRKIPLGWSFWTLMESCDPCIAGRMLKPLNQMTLATSTTLEWYLGSTYQTFQLPFLKIKNHIILKIFKNQIESHLTAAIRHVRQDAFQNTRTIEINGARVPLLGNSEAKAGVDFWPSAMRALRRTSNNF